VYDGPPVGAGSVAATDLVDQLAAHKTLGSAPREELAWLASHGVVKHLAEGDVLTAKDATVQGMYVVLSGHIAIFVERGTSRDKVMEWRAGDVTGLLPYSRMSSPPGNNVAQEPTTVLAVDRSLLREMTRQCHEVTAILVHSMVDRARLFTSSDLRNEKMASLGKLAAGLAHELNNPAAAIERSAALLDDRLEEAEAATRVLGASRLTDAQLAALDAVRASCRVSTAQGILSPLQRAQREDDIADWLAAHAVDDRLAALLADTAVTIDALDRIADEVRGPALAAVLRWAAAGCSVRELASEIQEAAMRITGLVQAVKGFTHMDQAPAAEPLDLATNLGNTVTVLKSKARRKSVAVTVDVEKDLPRVVGFVGELNQIWANLIDNALDAVPDGGRVDVSARCERAHVVVRVIDNGPGIPPDVFSRMFEPFFTTKPVGQGTGLGLDIVRRLLRHNDAEIDVESTPGHTEFRVRLPIASGHGAGGSR
jgi:signal transduction histidine kinase